MVLVDTSVWSLALRRAKNEPSKESIQLIQLIKEQRVVLIGPIRQEILSGIKDIKQFESLREQLAGFPDYEIAPEDYELAARFFNQCRAKGIQGSNTDFLICAIASRHQYKIFTTDKDFEFYAKLLDLKLFE